MALGDGTAWDETTPSNATNISDGDDHIRDLRIGTRIRMEKEHVAPAATSAGGEHKFITLQAQGTKPTLSGSQIAAVYSKDVAGVKELFFEDSAGTETQITTAGALNAPTPPASVPTGAITMWGAALASPPTGYLTCDGSAVSRTTYADLFAVVGSTWGAGDGSTTFNLPNFSNTFPYGANEGSSAGNASVGSRFADTTRGAITVSGNDNAVFMTHSGGFGYGSGNPGGLYPGSNSFPPYLAIAFIIKT
jgi:hypothetical protein